MKLINKFECRKKHLYRWIRTTFKIHWPRYKQVLLNRTNGADGFWYEDSIGVVGRFSRKYKFGNNKPISLEVIKN